MNPKTTRRGTPRKLMIVASLLLLALPLAALAAGWLGGAARPSFAAPPVPAPAPGTGAHLARVALYAAPNGAGGERKQFSASTDNVVYVQMQWLNLDNTMHDAYLTFRSPDGSIYQVQDVVFSASPQMRAGQTIKRPGVLHPIAVQAATALGPGGNLVWAQLPVAGTWMSRLLGPWQLQIRLDNGPTVLGNGAFNLAQ